MLGRAVPGRHLLSPDPWSWSFPLRPQQLKSPHLLSSPPCIPRTRKALTMLRCNSPTQSAKNRIAWMMKKGLNSMCPFTRKVRFSPENSSLLRLQAVPGRRLCFFHPSIAEFGRLLSLRHIWLCELHAPLLHQVFGVLPCAPLASRGSCGAHHISHSHTRQGLTHTHSATLAPAC